jgi:translation elongation factor EF-G
MNNCEENSCENFQSAICLHCMHRLCIYHIEDHQQILSNKIDKITNEVNQVNTVLMKRSNAIVEERQADVNKCINWRQQKIDEIEREYNNMLQTIIDRQKRVEQLQLNLNQRLKLEVQQPLHQMSSQNSINPHLLDAIQLTIETIRKDSEVLIWNSQE